MKVGASLNRAPFVGTVEARACKCDMPVKELFTARSAAKAVEIMTGYWSIYLTFFGDQTNWLRFTITDVRDGVVVWRDGRAVKEEISSGEGSTGESSPAAGQQPPAGEWIGEWQRARRTGFGHSRSDGW